MITINRNEDTYIVCFSMYEAGAITPELLKIPASARIVVPRFDKHFRPQDVGMYTSLNPARLLNIQAFCSIGNDAEFSVSLYRSTPEGDLSSIPPGFSTQTAVFQTRRSQIPMNESLDGYTYVVLHVPPRNEDRTIVFSFALQGSKELTILQTIGYMPPRPYIEGLHEYLEQLAPGERRAYLRALGQQVAKWSPEARDALESLL